MFQMKEEPQDTEFVSYSPTKKRSKRKSVPDDLTMEETSDLGPQIVKRKSWRHLKNISTRPGYAIPKEKQNAKLQSLTRPHIDSFNWFLHKGLRLGVRNITPLEFELNGTRIKLSYREAFVKGPRVHYTNSDGSSKPSSIPDPKCPCPYPSEARLSCQSYTGTLMVMVTFDIAGKRTTIEHKVADIPIMLKSDACILSAMKPSQLIAQKEDPEEIGGYFVVNGGERVIRMLVQQRRNFPVALERGTWKKHANFTHFGVTTRSVATDGTICTNTLHYTKFQKIMCSFIYNKQQLFVPLGLLFRGLVAFTDHEMYSRVLVNVTNCKNSKVMRSVMKLMFFENQKMAVFTPEDALKSLGGWFRTAMKPPDWKTDEEIGNHFLKKYVAIHLDDFLDKFNYLALSARKLCALVVGECAAESTDSPANMEVLTSGHLYSLVIKDKLVTWLNAVHETAKKIFTLKGQKQDLTRVMTEAISRAGEISQAIHSFISTGNIQSRSSLGLMQSAGMAVLAEKINFFRFLSHFRAVHRGSYYLDSRLTAVRKLQPESWGFICPVHTPDGAPCGLLNHLPLETEVSVDEVLDFDWAPVLWELNAVLCDECPPWDFFYEIMFNGKLIGYCSRRDGFKIANHIRLMKFDTESKVPITLEVAFLPFTLSGCQYPGIYLATHQCRMIRPVINFEANALEYIGSLEQMYLDVAFHEQKKLEGFTHQEISHTSILSFLANLTPFSECNPSPRNVYQCQMAKQTMGFPSYTLDHRSDGKMYVLQTPQSPLSRSATYESYKADEYPCGTNAIVAVISYTGYDMEDSMILNKSSVERGFMNAHLRKCYIVDLVKMKRSNDYIFACGDDAFIEKGYMGPDGLPPVGRVLKAGEPLYSYYDTRTNVYSVKKVDMQEKAVILSVRAIASQLASKPCQKAVIQFRVTRNPIIGDKNASRAGQKGICSRLFNSEDLPFTESGMVPDIIFNPNGFPSRMTVGMMIELLANKHAAVDGTFHDSSSFNFDDKNSAIEYFGNMLVERGFNFNGLETMYSGTSGEQLEAAIFFGPIYYQRLRHMVSDKMQGRTTGPIDPITKQPVKGRKRGGGIRVGEMERDGFLSHGAAMISLDRLLKSSDTTYIPVCTLCGTTTGVEVLRSREQKQLHTWQCRFCPETTKGRKSASFRGQRSSSRGTCGGGYIVQIPISAAYKYLLAELSTCNIHVTFGVSDPPKGVCVSN